MLCVCPGFIYLFLLFNKNTKKTLISRTCGLIQMDETSPDTERQPETTFIE